MYLCIKADQPMQKTFKSPSSTASPIKPRNSLEYWFEVNYNRSVKKQCRNRWTNKLFFSRSDQVYAFFLQWTPNSCGEAENLGFILMEKSTNIPSKF